MLDDCEKEVSWDRRGWGEWDGEVMWEDVGV